MTVSDETAMVEAAARAIYRNMGYVWGSPGVDEREAMEVAIDHARAAIAAIAPMIREQALEDAARVVLNWSLPTIQAPSMWLIDKQSIAAAIRAMGEKP